MSTAPLHLAAAPRYDSGTRGLGITIVVAIHLVVLYAILQTTPVRQTLTAATPLMVELIAPPKVVAPPPPPPPPPAPPKPRLEPLKATTPPVPRAPTVPLIEFVVPAAPAPAPAAPIAVAAAPAPPAAATASAEVAAPAPAPVTPPSFNASYLRNRPPAYPAASRRLAEEGRVVLRVLVSAEGDPERIEVDESSHYDRLDAAAIAAVRTWKFVPAQQAGRAVSAWVRVPLAFTLTR